jgi:hypothetical protein
MLEDAKAQNPSTPILQHSNTPVFVNVRATLAVAPSIKNKTGANNA